MPTPEDMDVDVDVDVAKDAAKDCDIGGEDEDEDALIARMKEESASLPDAIAHDLFSKLRRLRQAFFVKYMQTVTN